VRVIRAGRDYLRRAGVLWEKCRFDIVSLLLEPTPVIEWPKTLFSFVAPAFCHFARATTP